jgi:hypothetical protein
MMLVVRSTRDLSALVPPIRGIFRYRTAEEGMNVIDGRVRPLTELVHFEDNNTGDGFV